MGQETETGAEEFARALGVSVVVVPTLGGECAVFNHAEGVMEVCQHLCSRQRREAFEDLLGTL